MATSDQNVRSAAGFVASRHYTAEFFLQVPKLCTDLDQTLDYILTLGTYSKFLWENEMLALGIRFLHPCSM